MNIKTKTEKLFLSILAIALIIWLGGTITRTIIAYDNYIPFTQLELKPEYSDEIRIHNIYLFANISIYTIISFFIMVISAFIIFFYNIRLLKEKGWLFMSFVLFFLTIPFEIYSIILDINLLVALREGMKHFSEFATQDFIKNKFQFLSIVQPLVFLSCFSAIIILVIKPLDQSKNILNNQNETN